MGHHRQFPPTPRLRRGEPFRHRRGGRSLVRRRQFPPTPRLRRGGQGRGWGTKVPLLLAGTVLAEAVWAVLRPVPRLPSFDASGSCGGPDAPSLRFTVVGDSTTTGPGVDRPEDIWIRQLAHRLSDRYCVTVTSFATGGATAAQVRRLQLRAALEAAAEVAFVSVGANDALKGVGRRAFETHLDAIVGALSARAGIVVVGGVGDLGTIPRLLPPLRQLLRARGRAFDRIAFAVAARHGAIKVDMWGLTTHEFRTNPAIFAADSFHPSAVGHRVWADAAEAALMPHLERRGQG